MESDFFLGIVASCFSSFVHTENRTVVAHKNPVSPISYNNVENLRRVFKFKTMKTKIVMIIVIDKRMIIVLWLTQPV